MSRLDNFKGKMHVFTPEDRLKGSKTITWKRVLANRLNAMKSGRYSKGLKECVKCKVTFACPFRKASSECVLFSPKSVYKIMLAKELQTVEQFDEFISEFVKEYLKVQNSKESAEELKSFLEKMIELREIMK